jgi:AmmeMemoRadiSam system protein B/AmmeMemoRadiSam system protein A
MQRSGPRSPIPAPRRRRAWLCLFPLLLGLPGATANSEAKPMSTTRPSALAGAWYAADPDELAAAVDQHLAAGRPLSEIADQPPVALIAPHAGHQWSGDAAGCAYRLLAGEGGAWIRRVILLGPAHRQGFRGASILDVEAYETPLGPVALDRAVTETLGRSAHFQTVPRAHAEEHCLEIQLPFLQRVLQQPFTIVPILVSQLAPEAWKAMAAEIAPLVDETTLLLISSDFTHYGARFGYLPFRDDVDANLRRLDKGALVPILGLDAPGFARYRAQTEISVCGFHPIGVLLEVLKTPALQARWGGAPPTGRVLEYYRSADLLGDFDGSVSYAAVGFFPTGALHAGPAFPERLQAVHVPGEALEPPAAPETNAPAATGSAAAGESFTLAPAEQRFLLALARRTIETVCAGGELPPPPPYPEGVSAQRMAAPCGVFVTLHARGRLRGCIGTITGSEPLVDGVRENARNAALRDPRFPPVTAGEVAELEIEISVLTPLTPIAAPEEIEVGRHGVVLERAGHRAVFLPQVAPEQGWDRETMLDHLAMKAGLPREAWREATRLEVFSALVFAESESED